MPKVGRYCKAYPVGRLRLFAGWSDGVKRPRREAAPEDEAALSSLSDDDVLFLQEDFSVTEGIFLDDGVLFDDVTPEWKSFCEDELGFRVPAHLSGDDEVARRTDDS
ncbi:MAG: hypothetical protein WCD76_10165 [Pyrinomonadaceae bacterium]